MGTLCADGWQAEIPARGHRDWSPASLLFPGALTFFATIAHAYFVLNILVLNCTFILFWYSYVQIRTSAEEENVMNIFEFAMKMELDGKAYYERLAAETAVAGLNMIFVTLAADEQKHYDTIKAIKAGTSGAMTDSTVLEKSKNLFADLMGDKSIAGSLKKSLDGYKHARKIEADSVRFYEDAAGKESNPETARLLMQIASEEKKHYNIMDNLYDFALAPQNFLAWGEFSNLKEL
jgi:rubrerythrin